MSQCRGIGTPQERRKYNKSKAPPSSDDSRVKALDLGRLGFRPRAKETLASMLARLFCQPHLSVGLTSNSRDRIKVVGLRNREENSVPPERCGIRMDKFAGLKSLGAFAPTFFRDVKIAESRRRRRPPPDNRSCQGGLYLPATRSLSQCCQDNSLVSRSGRLGYQLWGGAPEFAATFSSFFSFRNFFRECLLIGVADY